MQSRRGKQHKEGAVAFMKEFLSSRRVAFGVLAFATKESRAFWARGWCLGLYDTACSLSCSAQ